MKFLNKTKPKVAAQNPNANRRVVALAGNPNVGKSTVFNALTGLKQHTGNWAGKTVANAKGVCKNGEAEYLLVDIPGTYSLNARSAEEEVARDFICFGESRAVIIVCDATCLERNLNLVLQTLEVTNRAVVCVNLLDEAERKGIKIDLCALESRLGVPVVGTSAQKKRNLNALLDAVEMVLRREFEPTVYSVKYPRPIEKSIELVAPELKNLNTRGLSARWLSLKLLENDASLIAKIEEFLAVKFGALPHLRAALELAREALSFYSLTDDTFKDLISSALVFAAENLCHGVVNEASEKPSLDRKLDKIFTSRALGYPVMILLLILIFWITISGANYPSSWLAQVFSWGEVKLQNLFSSLGAPIWLRGAALDGVYRVLTSVISVMLPPMAIFFPLFTLLEDAGYLPRVAFNLDRPFKNSGACGKQALTMCMGFGCNAVGVEGCRIIDSPRERLLAVLTNSLVPCNGRFGPLITVLTMFCAAATGAASGAVAALLLAAAIVFSVAVTLTVTKILSKTLLKGVPSSFALELPPYRKPQVCQVFVRSVLDRTLFVLGRAASVAAPAGFIIWLMANLQVGDSSLFSHVSSFLDPFARLLGLDGVILIAFILGFPANEIVLPIIVMGYSAGGSVAELGTQQMRELFVSHGWTGATAISVALFMLMHWPCGATLLTVKKETGSLKWAALAAIIPTLAGVICCIVFNFIVRCIGAM